MSNGRICKPILLGKIPPIDRPPKRRRASFYDRVFLALSQMPPGHALPITFKSTREAQIFVQGLRNRGEGGREYYPTQRRHRVFISRLEDYQTINFPPA